MADVNAYGWETSDPHKLRTPLERAVVTSWLTGEQQRSVAKRMYYSRAAVAMCSNRIRKRLNVRSEAEAVSLLIKLGTLVPGELP